jgi:hypothetical protein
MVYVITCPEIGVPSYHAKQSTLDQSGAGCQVWFGAHVPIRCQVLQERR